MFKIWTSFRFGLKCILEAPENTLSYLCLSLPTLTFGQYHGSNFERSVKNGSEPKIKVHQIFIYPTVEITISMYYS